MTLTALLSLFASVHVNIVPFLCAGFKLEIFSAAQNTGRRKLLL